MKKCFKDWSQSNSTVILAIISGGGFGGKDTRSSVYSIPVAIAAKKYEFDNYIGYTKVAAVLQAIIVSEMKSSFCNK